jgi:hypothetical protein
MRKIIINTWQLTRMMWRASDTILGSVPSLYSTETEEHNAGDLLEDVRCAVWCAMVRLNLPTEDCYHSTKHGTQEVVQRLTEGKY